jgi:hypothetical protein
MTLSRIRKIYQGIANRPQMFRMFDRHSQRPNRREGDGRALFAGEWFEIARSEYDNMLEILPPLWMRGEMFALREFLIGSITSVFYELCLDGKVRYFHAYCDMSQPRSPVEMRDAIVERESRPANAMTREEQLEHIWSATHDQYRGYAGERWLREDHGKRTVLVYRRRGCATLKLLDDLTAEEVQAKLPVHVRHPPSRRAA